MIEVVENHSNVMWRLPDKVVPSLLRISEFSSRQELRERSEGMDDDVKIDLVINHLLELNVLNKDMWINVKQERIGRSEKVIIIMNSNIRHVISQSTITYEAEFLIFNALINNLVFHQLLLTTIIRNCHGYEEIVEGSKLNQSIIWKEPAFNLSPLSHLSSETKNNITLKNTFTHYETNYAALMSDTDSLSLVGGLRFAFQFKELEYRTTYPDHVEDLIVKILTVSKLLTDGVESQDYTLEVQNIYKSPEMQNQMSRLQFKIEYFRAEKLFLHLKLSTANMTSENRQLLGDLIRNLEYLAVNVFTDSTEFDMT